MKRYYLYYIIGGIAVIALIAAFLFWFNRSSSISPTASNGTGGFLPTVTNTGTQTQPENAGASSGSQFDSLGQTTNVGGLGIVSSEQVLDYFMNASGTMITVQPDGKIEQISAGQSIYLSSQEISNVIAAKFSYDGQKIFIAFGGSNAPQSSVFDVPTKSWAPLPTNLITAAWSPINYQLAYFSNNNRGVVLQKIDLANAKAKPTTLLSLTNEDYELLWPTSSTIMITDRPSALFSGSIFALNLKTGTLSSIVQNRVGLEATWNANGTEAVISAGSALVRGGQLGIIDNGGNLLHQMAFLTLPTKCAFYTSAATSTLSATAPANAASSSKSAVAAIPSMLSQSIICGIPRDASMLSGNPLPDAYEEKRFMTSDDIYKINLDDGNVAPILNDPSQSFDISNVKIMDSILFFVNRYDQKLYGLKLGQQ